MMNALLQKTSINESKPDVIVYGYFIGKNKKSISKLKTALDGSLLNPIIIKNADSESGIFTRILESEAKSFSKFAREHEFAKVKLNEDNIDEIRWLFGDGYPFNKRNYK